MPARVSGVAGPVGQPLAPEPGALEMSVREGTTYTWLVWDIVIEKVWLIDDRRSGEMLFGALSGDGIRGRVPTWGRKEPFIDLPVAASFVRRTKAILLDNTSLRIHLVFNACRAETAKQRGELISKLTAEGSGVRHPAVKLFLHF